MEITEKKLKSILGEQRKTIRKEISGDVKRHIDILKEDFDSQVQMIVEQYDSIMERLDSHDDRFLGIEKKIRIS